MVAAVANGMHPESIACAFTDVVIIGGGVAGVMAANRMRERGIDYILIERLHDFGGIWHTHSNNYSTLQAPAAGYRVLPKMQLGSKGPLEQATGNAVLTSLREQARRLGIHEHTEFNSEVESIRQSSIFYLLVIRDTRSGSRRHLQARHVMVCHGIVGRPYLPEERGLAVSKSYRGVFIHCCRMQGRDCPVSSTDINGKVLSCQNVVVIGTGAFACEAMRAAVLNGAGRVTMVARSNARWIVPFSRQFIFFALVTAPLIPWAWKTALWKAWINSCYYRPCGLAHMIPVDSHPDTDFRGQASDEFFEHARSARLKVVVGPAKLIDEAGVHLKDGRVLPADMVCYCGGFEFQSSPPFLAELGLGFRDLHSFAFLGGSGRIGTASDTLLANVPVGPAQQLDMFLHAYDLCKAGRMQELQAALAPTPIDDIDARRHQGMWHSWFQASGKYSSVSLHTEVRSRAYARVMAAGLPASGRAWLRLKLFCGQLAVWCHMCWLAVLESLSVGRIY